MLKGFRKWGRLPDFEAVVQRFPVAVVCVGLLALYFMLDLDLHYKREEGMVLGLILAAYLCVGTQLAVESGMQVPVPPVFKTVLAAAAVLLSYFTQALAFVPALAVLAAIVFLGNFAFLGRERDDRSVWIFTQKLWTGAIFAFVGSIIFTLGVSAIWVTLNLLFDVDGETLATRFILPLGLAFLAPVYWLGTLPHPRDDAGCVGELSFEARALGFLGTWLLAPLTLIYGLIITAYAVRMLAQWDLPSNEIAGLVTPFIIVGTLTWLMLEPTVLKAGGLVRLYRRLWFPLMLAATVMLAVSAGVRIAEYGLTPERVGLLATIVAALCMAAWFTFTRRGDIRIPTAVAAAFLAAAAFVMKPVADVNQYLRVRSALQSADKTAVAARVQDGVRYLAYNANREDWVAALLGEDDVPTDSRDRLSELLDARGYVVPESERDGRYNDYVSLQFRLDAPVDISGYSRIAGQYDVRVYGDDDVDYRLPRDQEALVVNGELLFQHEGETVATKVGGFAGALYRDYLQSEPLRSSRRRNSEGVLATDSGHRIEVAMENGERGLFVVTELSLNGNGPDMTGGYGKGVLLTE